MKRVTARVLVLTFGVLAALSGLEIALRVFDPWGVIYFYEVNSLPFVPEKNGLYTLPAGNYMLSTFAAHLIHNSQRRVPDTRPSECRIVALGDSVTFGYGVEDDETFVNQLARMLPEVELINAGLPGFNAEQVRLTLENYPDADGYLYLIISNDRETTTRPTRAEIIQPGELFILDYVYALLKRFRVLQSIDEDVPNFWQQMDALAAHDELLLFAYQERVKDWFRGTDYPLIELTDTGETISFADSHPTPALHRSFAEEMYPSVKALVERVCPR